VATVALIRHWNSFFRLILMSNFLVQQQCGNKNTQEDKQWIPTVLLYLFNTRMAILEGASKSSTAFFTVYFGDMTQRKYSLSVTGRDAFCHVHFMRGKSYWIHWYDVQQQQVLKHFWMR
jgi:hypothetical protein